MKTYNIPKVKIKDGDTFYVGISEKGFDKGTIIHNDGTKTDVYKSVFHRAWAHLKIFFFH